MSMTFCILVMHSATVNYFDVCAMSALTLFVSHQEWQLACTKLPYWQSQLFSGDFWDHQITQTT